MTSTTDSDNESLLTPENPEVTLETILENLQDNNMLEHMMQEEPQPIVKISKGYRVPPQTLETHLFLDFLMVLTKDLELQSLKQNLGSMKFYPKYHQKKLSRKYFNNFDLTGHTFYLGKYADLDCFIVADPQIPCSCERRCTDLGTSGCMLDDISAIVMEKIVLQSLSKIDPVVLN